MYTIILVKFAAQKLKLSAIKVYRHECKPEIMGPGFFFYAASTQYWSHSTEDILGI